ncbi:MAG: metallophosphoesterase family protein [Spirochaetota bacterium]|nr:metallophosphoesterase family protein [Spirochaetota bacterium]
MKAGLISDTHIFDDEKLPSEIFHHFSDVDIILHAGDIFTLSALDELETIAPVLAAKGNGLGDPRRDPRIKKNHIIDLEGMKVGLIHNLGVPQLTIKNVFNGNVDIIVYGDTHIAELKEFKGIMLINPGSPTFPNSGERRPGTIAILEIANEKADASIIQLS